MRGRTKAVAKSIWKSVTTFIALPQGKSARIFWLVKRVSVAAILLLLVFDRIFPIGEQEDHYHYRCRIDSPPEPWWSFPETRNNSEAFWTAVAALGAIITLAFLYEQVAAGHETVKSFTQAEDGRVWVSNIASINVEGKKNRVNHFAIENVGRTAIEILSLQVRGACIPLGSDPPKTTPNTWQRTHYVMLGPGKKIGTKAGEEVVQYVEPDEWSDEDMLARTTKMDYMFRITVVYQTMFKEIRQYRIVGVWKWGETKFTAKAGVGWTFDEPCANLEVSV